MSDVHSYSDESLHFRKLIVRRCQTLVWCELADTERLQRGLET